MCIPDLVHTKKRQALGVDARIGDTLLGVTVTDQYKCFKCTDDVILRQVSRTDNAAAV